MASFFAVTFSKKYFCFYVFLVYLMKLSRQPVDTEALHYLEQLLL